VRSFLGAMDGGTEMLGADVVVDGAGGLKRAAEDDVVSWPQLSSLAPSTIARPRAEPDDQAVRLYRIITLGH